MPTKKPTNYSWHQADTQAALAELLADKLAAQIQSSINTAGLAVIALSGGSTPKPLFKALAIRDLEWSKLVITLVDERWVPQSHALSNAAFMQQYLLDGLPNNVTFVPLFNSASCVSEAFPDVLNNYCAATDSQASNPHRFDAVILGMGEDGHTASFFPDAENIADLVDINNPDYLLSCASPTTQVERITWSLPMLLNTPLLALHITGQNKRQVFDTALAGGSTVGLPIRSVIFQKQTPLHVYYAD